MYKTLHEKLTALQLSSAKKVSENYDGLLSEIQNLKSSKQIQILEARLLQIYFEKLLNYTPYPKGVKHIQLYEKELSYNIAK